VLWVALFLKNGNASPIGVVVAQAAQVQELVYFDEQMPVFGVEEKPKQNEEAEKAPPQAVRTAQPAQAERRPAQQRAQGAQAQNSSSANATGSVLVNINLGDVSELTKLPGIGAAMAQRIIEYRNQHGNFVRIEDIKNVSGIGARRFEAMKEFLTL